MTFKKIERIENKQTKKNKNNKLAKKKVHFNFADETIVLDGHYALMKPHHTMSLPLQTHHRKPIRIKRMSYLDKIRHALFLRNMRKDNHVKRLTKSME